MTATASIASSPVPTRGVPVPDGDFALTSTPASSGAPAVDAMEATAPTQLIARAPPLWRPSAAVLGVGSGAAVPLGWSGGAYMLMPGGNPLDWTTRDGTPSNAIFAAKNIAGGSGPNWMTGFTQGGVATYNPATNSFEGGYGGAIKVTAPGGVPVVGFLNIRGGIPENYTGSVSANFGIMASLDQAAAVGLSAAAALPKAGAGAAAASGFLRATGQAANVYAGAAKRVEARFQNGDLVGIYIEGQRIIDIEQFMLDAAANSRYRPPVIPNHGIPEIANYNYTSQLAFGTSPWDLAATSGGKNHGNGAIAVANSWRETIQAYGQRYYDGLPNDVQRTILFGPQSMAEAGRAVNALLSVASQGDSGLIVDALLNRYGLDFGVPAVKVSNDLRERLGQQRPGDYGFVRNVFEGDYRYPLDNPDTPRQQGGFRL